MSNKSSASLLIALAMLHTPAAADVMDEYRDPSFLGGYVVGEYLFDETSETDQTALAIYGEYDVATYATLYFRAQQAKIEKKPSMVSRLTKPRIPIIYLPPVPGFATALAKTTSMKSAHC